MKSDAPGFVSSLFVCLSAVLTLAVEPSIQNRPDGLWLVMSNTPPKWKLECSADLVTWHPYCTWQATDPMLSVEVRLSKSPRQFWRVTELP